MSTTGAGKGAGKGAAASGGRITTTAAKAKSGAQKGQEKVSSAAAGAEAAAGGKLEQKKRKRGAGADVTEEDLTSKRDRNRLAAKNCRQRKIDKENSLRVELEELQAKHAQLLERFNKLTGEVKELQK